MRGKSRRNHLKFGLIDIYIALCKLHFPNDAKSFTDIINFTETSIRSQRL